MTKRSVGTFLAVGGLTAGTAHAVKLRMNINQENNKVLRNAPNLSALEVALQKKVKVQRWEWILRMRNCMRSVKLGLR